MADTSRVIGQGVCPVCANTKARFSVSKSNLVCMTCNGCNCQIFARSDNSDERLRANIRATSATSAEPAPAAAAAPAPAAPKAKTVTTTPAAPKSAPPPAQDAPAGRGFGMLGTWI